MTTALVVGVGAVGVRAARQLLDTEGIDRVLVAARRFEHARSVAHSLVDGVEPVDLGREPTIPAGVSVVAGAAPGDVDLPLARAAIRAGIPFASVTDDQPALDALVRLDGDARAAGARAVLGCGLAPGLADVLVRHAANGLDGLDEIHVARWGVAGDACATQARRSRHEPAREWRGAEMAEVRRRSPELVWFPEPVGARECELVATGVELLVQANPGVSLVTVRLGAPPPRKQFRWLRRRDPGEAWASVRAEAWGWQGGARTTVIYGVIEQAGVASGTTLGVTAAWLAGVLPAIGPAPAPGVSGLGAAVEPVAFLGELAGRGVKAAAFEGVAVA